MESTIRHRGQLDVPSLYDTHATNNDHVKRSIYLPAEARFENGVFVLLSEVHKSSTDAPPERDLAVQATKRTLYDLLCPSFKIKGRAP